MATDDNIDFIDEDEHECANCGRPHCDCSGDELGCMSCEECQFEGDEDFEFDLDSGDWEERDED
jgi:hypothetical protein